MQQQPSSARRLHRARSIAAAVVLLAVTLGLGVVAERRTADGTGAASGAASNLATAGRVDDPPVQGPGPSTPLPDSVDGHSPLVLAPGPALNDYLDKLQAELDSRRAKPKNVGVLGVVTQISADQLAVQTLAPRVDAPGADVLGTRVTPAAGSMGAATVIVDSSTQFTDGSLSSLQPGEAIFAGGTSDDQAVLHATVVSPLDGPGVQQPAVASGAAQGPPPSGVPSSPSTAASVSGSALAPHPASAQLMDVAVPSAITAEAASGSAANLHLNAQWGNHIDIQPSVHAGDENSCPYFTASLHVYGGFGAEWHWPFRLYRNTNVQAPTVSMESLSRDPADEQAADSPANVKFTTDFSGYSFYSGFGVVAELDAKIGCHFWFINADFDLASFSYKLALVNQTYRHAPLDKEAPLDIPAASCLQITSDMIPALKALLDHLPFAFDAQIDLCAKLTQDPAVFNTQLHAAGAQQAVGLGSLGGVPVDARLTSGRGLVSSDQFDFVPRLESRLRVGIVLGADALATIHQRRVDRSKQARDQAGANEDHANMDGKPLADGRWKGTDGKWRTATGPNDSCHGSGTCFAKTPTQDEIDDLSKPAGEAKGEIANDFLETANQAGAGPSVETDPLVEFVVPWGPTFDLKNTSAEDAVLLDFGSPSPPAPPPTPPGPLGTVTNYPLPAPGLHPNGIALGPDGNVWIAEVTSDPPVVARVTPSGEVSDFSVGEDPDHISTDKDGDLWFTEQGSQIGELTPTGKLTEFTVPSSGLGGGPVDLAQGIDGNMWFTAEGAVGRITTSGHVSIFNLPTHSNSAEGITRGPDGKMWFAEPGGLFDSGEGMIGSVTAAGVVTEFPLTGGQPHNLCAGSDGNLWTVDPKGNRVVRVTPAGAMTSFTIPTADSGPEAINPGSDGGLWFTETKANNIGRIDPATGAIAEYPVAPADKPDAGGTPNHIIEGSDGRMWFTEFDDSKIGAIDL